MKIIGSFLFILMFGKGIMYSQTCCSGGVPLANGIGMENQSKGILQVGVSYDYNNLNTLNAGDTTLDDDSRLRVTHSMLSNISYNITDRLGVEGLFTWIQQRRRIRNFGNQNLVVTNGVGDAVLLIKYSFPDLIGKNSAATLGLGTKLPLGATENTDNRGIVLAADLQPGSGSWDMILMAMIRKSLDIRPSLSLFARSFYRYTGTNRTYLDDFEYRFGSELQVFLGISDQFIVINKLIEPSFSLKYRNAARDQIGEATQGSTGGNWVFMIPSLSIPVWNQTSILLRSEIPIYSYVEGTQLTPTYRLTFGIQTNFDFYKKSKLRITPQVMNH